MAITNAQQAKQLLQGKAPKNEFLAYINKGEAKALKKAGGSGHLVNGIPSFVGSDYSEKGDANKSGYQGGNRGTSGYQGGSYNSPSNTGNDGNFTDTAITGDLSKKTQTDNNAAAIAKGKAEKAAADKKAAEAKVKEEKKQEKKEATAKAKRDKKTKRIRTKAFTEFQKLDPYAVEEMGMYGYTPEEIAAGKNLGPVDLGTKKSALGKDSIYDDGQANELEVLGNIAGYDLTGLPMGRTTLTSNKGTSLEKTKANPYGLRTKTGIPSIDFLGGFMNPDDQIGAINTLNDARNIQDFAGRFADGDDSAYEEFEDYISRNTPTSTGGGGGENQQQTDPCLGPNPPAYCSVGNDTEEEDATPSRNLGGLAPRFAGSQFDFTGLADGGRAGAMDGGRMMMMANQEEDDPVGGIMDLETSRQMYGLGKLVKKITRGVKKIAKSPVGKAALMYFGGNALMGKMGGGKGLSSFFGKGSFNPLKTMISSEGFSGLGPSNFAMKLAEFGLADPSKMALTGLGKTAAIGLPSIIAGLTTPKDEDDTSAYDKYREEMGLDINKYRYGNYLAPNFTGYGKADGGRIGYAEGSEEPVAKETMPLIDMDGKEMDLREDGGFVPLGRMERADDVPARLSKNEFVFTADAVRNAGEGDVDKGAEVMYNMMKNLESGGDVSEESQGLEGAREMFQTSQRLEEVI